MTSTYEETVFRLFSCPVLQRGERLARWFDRSANGKSLPPRNGFFGSLDDHDRFHRPPLWWRMVQHTDVGTNYFGDEAARAAELWRRRAAPLRRSREARERLREVVQELHEHITHLSLHLEAQ